MVLNYTINVHQCTGWLTGEQTAIFNLVSMEKMLLKIKLNQ